MNINTFVFPWRYRFQLCILKQNIKFKCTWSSLQWVKRCKRNCSLWEGAHCNQTFQHYCEWFSCKVVKFWTRAHPLGLVFFISIQFLANFSQIIGCANFSQITGCVPLFGFGAPLWEILDLSLVIEVIVSGTSYTISDKYIKWHNELLTNLCTLIWCSSYICSNSLQIEVFPASAARNSGIDPSYCERGWARHTLE